MILPLIIKKIIPNFREKAIFAILFLLLNVLTFSITVSYYQQVTFCADQKKGFRDHGHGHAKKAHGHDDISMGLLKICDIAVVKLLSLLFKNCI